MTQTASFPRSGDLDLIALSWNDEAGTRSAFTLGPPLLRHDGVLYGGTAISASVISMEAATQRPVLWVTTQFVAPTPAGKRVEVACDVLASGARTAQTRVTGTVDGEVQFISLGATGIAREGGLQGQFEEMPQVTSPEANEGFLPRPPIAQADEGSGDDPSFHRLCEYRPAEIISSQRAGDGETAMWARFRDGRPLTPAAIAFAADMVPLSIARAAGMFGAGSSLDNTLRFVGVDPDTEWMLLEMQGNIAEGGYGHGTIRVWSQDGRQLAVGSQTASMIFVLDPSS